MASMTYQFLTAAPTCFNARQTLFFVMSSRKRTAVVVAVHVLKADAEREARALNSCVRFGYVQGGMAVTV
jgi:hypothetical protein